MDLISQIIHLIKLMDNEKDSRFRVTATDRVISDICERWLVNEYWLRNGGVVFKTRYNVCKSRKENIIMDKNLNEKEFYKQEIIKMVKEIEDLEFLEIIYKLIKYLCNYKEYT